ncbi:MAG: ATP-dependent helicase [Bacteroidetes bacterium]|uniref:DNA 3'-5' helicase n=1 Tax=Candidatus Merdivivens pullistercoris TaxID=2840873 RepID=A0A9D9N952_9BACT|nr:ATP-dependent helicase [Candidatus Merdivivens pullistercoris]
MDLLFLNAQQRAAVEYNGKHLMVLAGAGTGKTRTIVARAAYLIFHGTDPKRIQILSFTRKSAGEIVERVKAMLPETKGLDGSTFHSWCYRITRSNPKIFPFSDFTILDESEQEDVFRFILGQNSEVAERTGIKAGVFKDVYSKVINTCCSLSMAIKDIVLAEERMTDAQKDEWIRNNKKYFEIVIHQYIDYKEQHKRLDYDDLLLQIINVLGSNPDAKKHIASKYDHILVDEMQDTNPLQWRLLTLFIDDCHLFCVGDDAQSIYGFRGADFRNVHSFRDRVTDSSVMKLEDNYRSTQEILDVSNWLISKSPLKYDKQLRSVRGTGNKPELVHFDSEWDEAGWIADDIMKGITDSEKSYSNYMVLSRTSNGTRTLQTIFTEKKIPYQVFGGMKLIESAHIKDVLSALKITANVKDDLSWMRYLKLWQGIGNKTSAKLIEGIGDCKTMEDCITMLKKMKIKDSDTIATLDAIKDMNNNPSKALEAAVEHMQNMLSARYGDDWERKSKDFPVLIKVAESYSTVTEFLSDFTLNPILDEGNMMADDSPRDVVTISTIHSAKGLEADTCYVLNVSPGVYPMARNIAKGSDEIEEERRCLYVALTRAKNRLVVTRNIRSIQCSNETIGQEDNEMPNNNTYFFNELPDTLFETECPKDNSIELDNSYTGCATMWIPAGGFDFN